ncbi:MAG: sulfur-oxidizing protein SoxA [Candidatus Kentron sp. G]|nr:MAG: sulfur-oxidizing protein SoxA [Candidatus Kentron sp. G]VFN03346.1 MAG: sulfur-oxidizing protein SoxA [Candidatus Kentron sp. G]VFN04750.1 MAG: sulfur-oxidizing protein SoxA [Candidatus Kentron sp. G]
MGNNRLWHSVIGLGAIGLGAVAALMMLDATAAPDPADPALKDYIAGDRYSGYVVNTSETRAIQDDDFENPGFMWVEQAEEIWGQAEGKAGKSCASCHTGGPNAFKGIAARYPKVADGKLMTIEHRIGQCRTERMGAPAWKWESDEMLGMSALVRLQSRGMPVNVGIDGEAAPFFQQGKAFYHQRRGALDLACYHCHVRNHGNKLRSDQLSMGMPNGFPTYRLKWQKLGSLHRRFRGCNKNVRAEPYNQGSPEYTALELYVMHRARGLPIESPSVRK